ncbi:hypothetical protein SESBI_30449 [Sesbania bispinosa]|nr:hypothetical protein SESBI_30449 [Sesbania bispinosa]
MFHSLRDTGGYQRSKNTVTEGDACDTDKEEVHKSSVVVVVGFGGGVNLGLKSGLREWIILWDGLVRIIWELLRNGCLRGYSRFCDWWVGRLGLDTGMRGMGGCWSFVCWIREWGSVGYGNAWMGGRLGGVRDLLRIIGIGMVEGLGAGNWVDAGSGLEGPRVWRD